MTRAQIAAMLATVNAEQHEGFIKFTDLVMNEYSPSDIRVLGRALWSYFVAGWSRDTEIR